MSHEAGMGGRARRAHLGLLRDGLRQEQQVSLFMRGRRRVVAARPWRGQCVKVH